MELKLPDNMIVFRAITEKSKTVFHLLETKAGTDEKAVYASFCGGIYDNQNFRIEEKQLKDVDAVCEHCWRFNA